MRNNGLLDFIFEEHRPLVGIAIILLGIIAISAGVFRQGLPVPTYTDVANLIVAYVAITSLYLAWRELIRKTRPNVTLDFTYDYPDNDDVQEQMILKLTNSGTNVVTPSNVWYGYVKRSGNEYTFKNAEMSEFQEDGLEPGETAEIKIGNDIVMLRVTNLNIRDWRGEGVTISQFPITDTQNRIHVVGKGEDIEVKVQKLFDEVMKSNIGLVRRFSKDRIQSSEVDKVLSEAGLAGDSNDEESIIVS
ncbi:hypothetical protein [Halovivax asiaticus]|nr:hypothetical protein [Halovivax asiaticus]